MGKKGKMHKLWFEKDEESYPDANYYFQSVALTTRFLPNY
jgi:hypothetical protein